MATETEQLVVLLEARIKDFERNMAKASSTAQKEFGAIERRASQSARKMQTVFGDAGNAIKGNHCSSDNLSHMTHSTRFDCIENNLFESKSGEV